MCPERMLLPIINSPPAILFLPHWICILHVLQHSCHWYQHNCCSHSRFQVSLSQANSDEEPTDSVSISWQVNDFGKTSNSAISDWGCKIFNVEPLTELHHSALWSMELGYKGLAIPRGCPLATILVRMEDSLRRSLGFTVMVVYTMTIGLYIF